MSLFHFAAAVDLEGRDCLRGLVKMMLGFQTPCTGNVSISASGRCALGARPRLDGRHATEHQPVESRALAGVASSNLSNRSELCRVLRQGETATDTELIIASYERWGEACVHRLEGDFSFVIWDDLKRRLFCARDRFGIRPLYYGQQGQSIFFSSTEEAISRVPNISLDLSRQTISEFLIGEVLDSGTTLLEAVKRIPAAHVAIVANGRIAISCYWKLEPNSEPLIDPDAKLRNLLTCSVAARLGDGLGVGSLLSGGLDSSSIACLARDQLRSAYSTLR